MSNIEQTLSIIKPDAVERNLSEKIKEIFLKNELKILESKKIKLSVDCLLYTSPSPRDLYRSRMPSSA